MTNYEWLLHMDGAERQAWFDAEHDDMSFDAALIAGVDDTSKNSEILRNEQDSREKIEADVRKWCAMMGMQPYQLDFVYGWLDRQAAITERECRKPNWDYCETCEELQRLQAECDKLNREIEAIKAANDDYRADAMKNAQILGECMADRDAYRELCSKMLDGADNMRQIAVASGLF